MTDSIYIPTLADTSEDQAIGANAKFLRGFTLEKFYMIDARSIVTRDIKEHALVHGSLVIHRGYICKYGVKIKNNKTMSCLACS